MRHESPLHTSARHGLIDVLRGWAVIAVVLLHLNIRVPFKEAEIAAGLSRRALNFLFSSGYQGVIVFFVISGFLITTVSLQRWGSLDRISRFDFYLFRVARLAPCLLLFIVVQSVLQGMGVPAFSAEQGDGHLLLAIASALTFWLNWAEALVGYLPGAWDVLWSLSVEEAFYLGFPLLCLLLRGPKRLIAGLLVFVVLGPFSRTVFSSNEIWMDHAYLSGMGEIAMGCITAVLVHRYGYCGRHAGYLLAVGAALMALVLYFRGWVFQLGLTKVGLDVTTLALGTALVLAACYGRPGWSRYAAWPGPNLLQWFGRHSYEIYLSHMFVVLLTVPVYQQAQLPTTWLLPFYLANVAVCGLLGHALARYFSTPLNHWLRQCVPAWRRGWTLTTQVR
ncbi:acyltransferase family protein [Chitinimonas naiadis]